MSELLPGFGAINQFVVVVAAFSILIFVHELGHYLAARMTGVRVERFFIGFDIFGLAIKKKYKGTVYGIGILPLGGYCSLAGQNDDPRKERRTGAPDELQSKPLWARGLVFGGGVIMNFIFGFLILIVANLYGIPFIPPILGQLDPNGPAALYGFQSGDRVLKVDGRAVTSFEEAAEAIALSGAGGEMDVEIERLDADGTPAVMTLHVKGRGSEGRGNLNTIGAEPLRSRIVGGVVDDPLFTDLMAGKLGLGDEILAVNGVDIPENQGVLIQRLLVDQPGKDAALMVKAAGTGVTREVRVPLETYGVWDLGLRIGIVAVNVIPDGPAGKAGLKPGDTVVAIQLPGDDEPRRLSSSQEFVQAVNAAALRPIAVTVNRDGKETPVAVAPALAPVSLGVDARYDTLLGVEGHMDGDRGFVIENVLPGSPGDGALLPGDLLTAIQSKPLPAGKSLREAVEDEASPPIRLFVARSGAVDDIATPPRRDVPDANLSLRMAPRIHPDYRRPLIGIDLMPGPVVAVEPDSFADAQLGGGKRLIGSRLAVLQYSPDLGSTILRFLFPKDSPFGGGLKTFVVETPEEIRGDPETAGLRSRLPVMLRTAEEVEPMAFMPAVAASAGKWVDLALSVYRVLHKLVIRDIPLDAVGGPVQLFRIIKIADERGLAYFLYILALISVNLGVCNLLPFPVLDGGHLMFLLMEWVMGKPPPLKIRETAQWIGLVCLLALMLTVTGYDLLHLIRGTG